MKLSFFGADQCVTGSCHCLEVGGKRILIDCGLQQGRDEVDNRSLPFAPGSIDYALITHAHIDHSGRVPMLIKNGFQGRILTTRLTAQLMSIMLQDSAHIQESDAEYKNRKNRRAGRPEEEPLYTVADAQRVPEFIDTCEYGQPVHLCDGVDAVFIDAGHLLGSASIRLTLTEGGQTKTIVFSGDIGNVDQPIIRDPQFFTGADYVVMESTYGDRNHTEVWSYTGQLAQIIDETLGKGGNVVIPSFAVGRTQELLYFIREIKDQGLVTSVPNFPVYVDSPLAKSATTIFCGDLRGYLDEDALELVKDGALSAGHARALLPVKDEAQQLSIAQKVMALGLSVRQTEALCKKLTKQAQPVKEQPPRVDYLAECEKELTAGLGRKVRIVSGKRKGRIELEYYGQDDLQQLYDALHTIRKKEQH